MKAKNVVINVTKIDVTEADRKILKNYLSDYEVLELSKDKNDFALNDEDYFELEIVLLGTTYHLELFPYEIRTSDFQSAVDGKLIKEKSLNRTYKGNVKNTTNRVRLLITDNGLSGFIQLDADQKLFIHPSTKFNLNSTKPTVFVVYYGKDVIAKDDFFCGVTSEMEKRFLRTIPTPSSPEQASSECLILKIATDADYAFYLNQGSSVANANDEILSMINQIEDVYLDTFSLALRVTFQNVWTVSDPYIGDPSDSGESSAYLNSFRTYWEINYPNVNRDIFHLVTGVNANVPGAYGMAYVGVVCSAPSDAYGYTRERFRDYVTMAHEIGHNLGGEHEGEFCDTPQASLMCQGMKQYDPMYFGTGSTARISNYINGNNACLDPALAYKIAGSLLICNSEEYTVTHLLPSVATVWSALPANAVTIVGSGNTRTLTRNPTFNGSFILSIAITSNCGIINISRYLCAGAPINISVDGFIFVPRIQPNIYMAQNVRVEAEVTDFTWFVIPDPSSGAAGGGITPGSPGIAEIWFENTGTYDVGVNVTNPCGWVESDKLTVEVF